VAWNLDVNKKASYISKKNLLCYALQDFKLANDSTKYHVHII